MAVSVQQHYGSADIVARILAATQDHAARLSPDTNAHLLDIGSGIGGPARYLAANFGCRVTGIDLTPSFVAAAQELTTRCGLADKVDFAQADAANLPFADAQFDHVTCFYFGMNLPYKVSALAQALRVLKPGGRLIWTEMSAGTGTPIYPLPWAREPQASHVEPRDSLVAKCSDAGFMVDQVIDETDLQLELAQKIRASGQHPSDGQNQANAVVLGADFAERRRNFIQSMGQGLIRSTLILAHKPG